MKLPSRTLLLALVPVLVAASSAARAQAAPTHPFSLSGSYKGSLGSTSAWVASANYSLASGSLLLGYGRQGAQLAPPARQFSIGYAYPLSRRVTLFADMADKRSQLRIRHIDMGIRAAF